MQSIRRAALRSAISASRTISSTTRSTTFASQIARTAVAPVTRQTSIIAARFFSQTGRVANEEKVGEEAEEAKSTEAVEETTAAKSEFVPGTETPYGIFVRNMVFDVNEEHLTGLFEKFGTINYCRVARDAGKMSKGFGFIFFTTKEAQEEAIRNVDGTFWHGRRIYVQEKQQAGPRTPRNIPPVREPCRHIYIGNIPFDTTDATLNDLFGTLDGVVDVRVAVDRTTGWPRGFCHVDFRDDASALKAYEALKDYQLGGRTLKIDWATPPKRYEDRNSRGAEQQGEGEGQF